MAKADTGAAGLVVAEFAYRNDYITAARPDKLADEVWRRDNARRRRRSRHHRRRRAARIHRKSASTNIWAPVVY